MNNKLLIIIPSMLALFVIAMTIMSTTCNRKFGMIGGLDQPCYRDGTCDMNFVCEAQSAHSHICSFKK